ncbi:MAG: hypothetical protein FD139_3605 [Methylocystaceae bacterium]|nr:MAG: hypothetical protein FD172_3501 [Methylocystaceae bacterium]TXT42433.1 MAG: hypothetical protein FD139_3605 [Methylocystaceae bacterium]
MSPHGEIASPWGEDNIPAVVQTITAKQITEQVNASNAVETLRYLPSIEIVEKFPGDRFQDIRAARPGPSSPPYSWSPGGRPAASAARLFDQSRGKTTRVTSSRHSARIASHMAI